MQVQNREYSTVLSPSYPKPHGHHLVETINQHNTKRMETTINLPFKRSMETEHSVRDPPIRPRFERPTSANMLPSSSLVPSKTVFSTKHRLVKRNLPFFQSENALRVASQHAEIRLFALLTKDWFHVVLRMNLWLSLLVLLSIWTVAIIVFAGIYMRIDRAQPHVNCGLGVIGSPIEFAPAFAFSLETCTTVGCVGLRQPQNIFQKPVFLSVLSPPPPSSCHYLPADMPCQTAAMLSLKSIVPTWWLVFTSKWYVPLPCDTQAHARTHVHTRHRLHDTTQPMAHRDTLLSSPRYGACYSVSKAP